MNFQEIKKLAIKLYREGKTELEIKEVCKIPVSKDLIEKWIQEDKQKQHGKTVQKLESKIKKLKQVNLNPKNKKEILGQISELAFLLLEEDPENQFAIKELIRCDIYNGKYDLAKDTTTKLLEKSPYDEVGLYYMTKIELESGDINEATKYNNILLAINKDNKNANIQKNLIEQKVKNDKQKELLEIQIAKEEEERKQVKEEPRKSLEEEQKEYALSQTKTDKYTIENKKEYIDQLNQMLQDGKINKENINSIITELYKYPDQVENALFASELYSNILENNEKAIDELNKIIDESYSLSREDYKILNSKISNFRDRIEYKKFEEQEEIKSQEQIEKQKEKEKNLKAEQRAYMQSLIQQLDKGKIKKEDIPSIVKNLESYPDRAKSIFLIMKLYEGFYDKDESLKYLAKCSKISNLNQGEIEAIAKMKMSVALGNNKKWVSKRIKKVKQRKKAAKKQEKLTREVSKKQIVEQIKQGKSVAQIYSNLLEQGKATTVSTIGKIKTALMRKDETLKKSYDNKLQIATELLNDGYRVDEIYNILESDVSVKNLMDLKKQIENKKDVKNR